MRHPFYNFLAVLALIAVSLQANAQAENAAAIYKLDSASSMDSALNVLMIKFPDNGDHAFYDDIRTYIAMAFASRNDTQNVAKQISQLKDEYGRSGRYFRLASTFRNTSNNLMAEKYAKLAIDTALFWLKKGQKDNNEGLSPASSLAASCILLAGLLEDGKRYNEAIGYLSGALPYCSEKNRSGLMLQEGGLLAKANRYNEAMEIYLDLLKAQNGGPAIEAKMKEMYVAIHNGSDAGFDAYLTTTKEKFQQAFTDSIRKSTFREKAADFVLRDLNGKETSLKNYLGQVVVLDFWATWCGPCKASFPAMQGAVNKYTGNKDVVFLFIDTWEYSDTPQEAIRNLLTSKNFSFTVLLDAKDKQTGECEVVKKYGVDGIPAKFIIDKKGFIRYKLKGFNGDLEASVKELSDMIDIAGKG